MAEELTYALITPYSLHKSRTGGIISRLLSLCPLELAATRMYAFSDEFVDNFMSTCEREAMPADIRKGFRNYVDQQFRPDNRFGISNRAMVLLFRGPDAVRTLQETAVGEISMDVKGDTVRGTYGDVIKKPGSDEFLFFEPAVVAPTSGEANRAQLKLLADYAESDGGILTNVMDFEAGRNIETTLVIIKPDNFMKRSSRPGNIIDVFSRTGLFIVGTRLLRMTQKMGEQFYAPLREAFVEKLKGNVRRQVREAVGEHLDFPVSEEQVDGIADILKDNNAEHEYRKIVDYMSGREVADVPNEEVRGRCMTLLYQGENAIQKIRDRLGATNPAEAKAGTVRSSYGHDLMKNGAHASDSPENAERERRIVGMWEENETPAMRRLVEEYLGR